MEMVYYPEDFRFFLKNEFDNRMRRRPHYSLRAFARDLELSPSTVSDFLNGKMGFSKARVHQLSKKLCLNIEQRDHWLDLLEAKFSRNTEERKIANVRAQVRSAESKNRLALEHFQFISEWQHLAILELIDLSPQYHSVGSLAKALGLGTMIIRDSLERLEKLEMVNISKSTWTTASSSTIVGGSIVSNQAIRSYHAQVLEKAAVALETQPIEKRESRSTIFSIPEDKIPELKNELNTAIINLVMKYAQMENRNSAYCLSLHLFSLIEKES